MSRTDKDRPYRVRVADTTLRAYEDHTHHSHYAWRRSHLDMPRWGGMVEHACDLPERSAAAEHPSSAGWTCCDYDLAWWADGRYRSNAHPPRWFINHIWHAPERTRARDTLREVVKEYNGEGEIDFYDYPNFQHRNRAAWYWE